MEKVNGSSIAIEIILALDGALGASDVFSVKEKSSGDKVNEC